MNNRLVHPQEIEVWYILPSIRKELVLAMKKIGCGQKKIAELLGITEAAVSQYCSKKRAQEIKFDKSVKSEIEKSADRIVNEKGDALREIQRILKLDGVQEIKCSMHKKHKGAAEDCEVCCCD